MVLVTGANFGIGAGLARAFARQGGAVLLRYLPARREPGGGFHLEHEVSGASAPEALPDEITASAGRAAIAPADLSDPAARAAVFLPSSAASWITGHVIQGRRRPRPLTHRCH